MYILCIYIYKYKIIHFVRDSNRCKLSFAMVDIFWVQNMGPAIVKDTQTQPPTPLSKVATFSACPKRCAMF